MNRKIIFVWKPSCSCSPAVFLENWLSSQSNGQAQLVRRFRLTDSASDKYFRSLLHSLPRPRRTWSRKKALDPFTPNLARSTVRDLVDVLIRSQLYSSNRYRDPQPRVIRVSLRLPATRHPPQFPHRPRHLGNSLPCPLHLLRPNSLTPTSSSLLRRSATATA